jgi:RNA polymerase sigma-70 factor (ECF subfamily)
VTPPSAATVSRGSGSRLRLPVSRSASSAATAADDNRAWINSLNSEGATYDRAVERLHELLVRAARFEVSRRRASLRYVRGEELEDIAMQAADDALMAVLRKLDSFRGDSRFTTWAYKFALLEAAVRLRRRAWQDREMVLDADGWTQLGDSTPGVHDDAERSELLQCLSDCIAEELTPHQREVLVALAMDGVPIDVLAERLGSNRNALYKALHDARRKLRRKMNDRGFPLETI